MSLDVGHYVGRITSFRLWVAIESHTKDLSQPVREALDELSEVLLKKLIDFRPGAWFGDSHPPHYSDKIEKAVQEVLDIPGLKRETRRAFKNVQRILQVAEIADQIHRSARIQLGCHGKHLTELKDTFFDVHMMLSCRRNPNKRRIVQSLTGVALSLEQIAKDNVRQAQFCHYLRDFTQAVNVGKVLTDVGFHGPAFMYWLLDTDPKFFERCIADRVAAYPDLKLKYLAHIFDHCPVAQTYVLLPSFHADLKALQPTTLHFKQPIHHLKDGAPVQLNADLCKVPLLPNYPFKAKAMAKSAPFRKHPPLESCQGFRPEARSLEASLPEGSVSYWFTPAGCKDMYEVNVTVDGKTRHHRVKYVPEEGIVRFCPKEQVALERTFEELKKSATAKGFQNQIQVTLKCDTDESEDLVTQLQKLYPNKQLLPLNTKSVIN